MLRAQKQLWLQIGPYTTSKSHSLAWAYCIFPSLVLIAIHVPVVVRNAKCGFPDIVIPWVNVCIWVAFVIIVQGHELWTLDSPDSAAFVCAATFGFLLLWLCAYCAMLFITLYLFCHLVVFCASSLKFSLAFAVCLLASVISTEPRSGLCQK